MAPLCEVRVYSGTRRYAGTLDVLGTWRGGGALADYKTGDPDDCGTNLQTAAYHSALMEMLQNEQRPDDLVFDEATHTYSLDGQRLPSVTQILEWAHVIDFSNIPEPRRTEALLRGSIVHDAAHAYNDGSLDLAAFVDTYPTYVPYLQAWIDFRQLSGFEMATLVPEGPIARYAVRLKDTGRYAVEPYDDPQDYLDFDDLVVAWHKAAKYFNAWPKERALHDAA